MPTIVDVHEASSSLSSLLERVKAGEEIVLAKAGKPYARLVPLEHEERELGFVKGEVSDSFLEPLPDNELEAWD